MNALEVSQTAPDHISYASVDTIHHKEDHINFCFVRLPVFQGEQCRSETTLNVAIYL